MPIPRKRFIFQRDPYCLHGGKVRIIVSFFTFPELRAKGEI